MRKAIVIFLCSLLAVSIAGTSDAQFWKKKSNRKKHRQEQPEYQVGEYQAEQPMTREQRRLLKKKQRMERKLAKRERKHLKKQKVVRVTEVAVDTKGQEVLPQPGKEERESDNEPIILQEKKQEAREEKASRKNRKRKREPVMPPVVKTEFEFPPTKKKSSYRVDVLASLYLDEIMKQGASSARGRIPEKAMPGMAFYKGVQIAADSLKNAGFNIDIYIHDITSEPETPENLISGKKLDSADLVMAAIQPHDIPELAEYAKGREVNFISAFSPNASGIKDNHYFTLVQPTLKSHCEWITSDIAGKFPGQNATLLYRTTEQVDENAYNYIKDAATSINLQPLECNTVPSKNQLAELIDPRKTDIVIVSILDKSYADSLLAVLSESFPSTHFEVYGMPSWASGNGADFDNLSVNITTPFNFDQSLPVTKYINKQYRKEFTDKPTELVYRGFEAMFWYANLLKNYGTIFNEHYSDNSAAPFTKFEIKPEYDKDGNFLYYENKHIIERIRERGPLN